MITNGIEPYFGTPTTENPYVEDAVKQLQTHNVVLFSIYAGGAGHFGHSFWRISWAQTYLSELADRTGGESYIQGFTTPVSFAPYLQDISDKLNHQYLLTFAAPPENPTGLVPVKVSTELPNVDLLAADRVFIQAGM